MQYMTHYCKSTFIPGIPHFGCMLQAKLLLVERNVSLFAVNNADWKQIFKESSNPTYRKISETMIVKNVMAYIDEKHRNAVLGQS